MVSPVERWVVAIAVCVVGAVLAGPGEAGRLAACPATHGTTVALRSFSAQRVGARTVALRWRTKAEAGLVGFDLFRLQGERRERLNRLSIAARNTAAAYSYLDRYARRGAAQYRLEAVSLNGTRTWLCSVGVR